MEIIKIIAMAVTGVALASLMKSVNKEMSIYIIIATVILIFLSIAGTLTEIFDFLENIYSNVTYGRTFFPVIIKILAVAYITDFTSQLCKDADDRNEVVYGKFSSIHQYAVCRFRDEALYRSYP